MNVMGHEWAYECPDCGRIGQHAKTCGMFPLGIVDAGNRVEVVRAADQGAVDALAELVRLKDGPRDEAYRAAKDAAWDEARAVLARLGEQ